MLWLENLGFIDTNKIIFDPFDNNASLVFTVDVPIVDVKGKLTKHIDITAIDQIELRFYINLMNRPPELMALAFVRNISVNDYIYRIPLTDDEFQKIKNALRNKFFDKIANAD